MPMNMDGLEADARKNKLASLSHATFKGLNGVWRVIVCYSLQNGSTSQVRYSTSVRTNGILERIITVEKMVRKQQVTRGRKIEAAEVMVRQLIDFVISPPLNSQYVM